MPNNPVKMALERASELDLRRQNQIRNQVASINRLMDGASYGDEMNRLHIMLATAQRHIEFLYELLHENKIPLPRGERCGICGDPEDHDGVPHSVATGDGKTRADVAETAAAPTD